ncbi:MAG: molybdopterin molybdotransferase MoeA [Chthoniobacterales bacterium]
MRELISVEEAEQLLTNLVRPAPVTTQPLDSCAGHILREDITADRDLPPFDRVMLDGYAARWPENPEPHFQKSRFEIVGKSFAGDPTATLPDRTDCMLEVMTGSSLPKGADTVIPFEDTEISEAGYVCIKPDATVTRGQAIHRQGSDFPQGKILLQSGSLLGPAESEIAASCGYAHLQVSQYPRITVIGTGDELVPVEATPKPWQIRRSNALGITTALRLARFPVHAQIHLSDNQDTELPRLIQAVENSDIVITSGAISMGSRDWLPAALSDMGECIFHGISQRPGKPMGVWVSKTKKLIFSLPGNPVATLVGVHRYILPYLQRCSGLRAAFKKSQSAILKKSINTPLPLSIFLPVILDDFGVASPLPTQNSGDYARLASTTGFVELNKNQKKWDAGTEVPYYGWQK